MEEQIVKQSSIEVGQVNQSSIELGHELGRKPDEIKKIAYERYEIDSMAKMTKNQAGDFIKFLENGMSDENMPEVMSEEVPLDLGEGEPGFSGIPF